VARGFEDELAAATVPWPQSVSSIPAGEYQRSA
jgi:hypothetical protein